MRTINEIGLKMILQFLEANHRNGCHMNADNLAAWANEAECAARGNAPLMIEVSAIESFDRTPKIFTIPYQGIDGCASYKAIARIPELMCQCGLVGAAIDYSSEYAVVEVYRGDSMIVVFEDRSSIEFYDNKLIRIFDCPADGCSLAQMVNDAMCERAGT